MAVSTIPLHLVERLVSVGRSSDLRFALVAAFTTEECRRYEDVMRQRPEPWKAVAERLSGDDLEALVRALTVAESVLDGWQGGSVSAVIWTFHAFSLRYPDRARALADWVLAHTDNPYAPFGRSNFGARSLAELARARDAYAARRAAVRAAEEERERAAKLRRAEKATRDLFGAIRRRDLRAVEALLAKGADPRARDSDGRTAIECARLIGHGAILAFLERGSQQ